MKKLIDKQIKARELRWKKWSINKIAKEIKAAKSSVSVWVRDIKINENEVIPCQSEKKRNEKRENYERCKRKCKYCDEDLPYEKRHNMFCGHKCSGKFYHPKKKPTECLNCRTLNRTSNNKFCSAECSVEYDWKMKIEKSEKSGKSHSGNQPSTKRLILKIRGHQCEICSRKDWDGGKIPLVLDHIDGNSDNWKMDNLRLVCGNCNMLLPTFTSKNKNSKRTNRKKYYKCQK